MAAWRQAAARLMSSAQASRSCLSQAAGMAAKNAVKQGIGASMSNVVRTPAAGVRGGHPGLSLLASSMLQSRFMTAPPAPAAPPPQYPSAPSSSDVSSADTGSSPAGAGGSGLVAGEEEESVTTHRKRRPKKRLTIGDPFDPGPGAERDAQTEPVLEAAKQEVFILPRSDCAQARDKLTRSELAFLWTRAQQLQQKDKLAEVKLSKAGPTSRWLSRVGDMLERRELVQVRVNRDVEGHSPEFIGWLLERTQDCVVVRTIGRKVIVFRDASHPRPYASRYIDPATKGDAKGVRLTPIAFHTPQSDAATDTSTDTDTTLQPPSTPSAQLNLDQHEAGTDSQQAATGPAAATGGHWYTEDAFAARAEAAAASTEPKKRGQAGAGKGKQKRARGAARSVPVSTWVEDGDGDAEMLSVKGTDTQPEPGLHGDSGLSTDDARARADRASEGTAAGTAGQAELHGSSQTSTSAAGKLEGSQEPVQELRVGIIARKRLAKVNDYARRMQILRRMQKVQRQARQTDTQA